MEEKYLKQVVCLVRLFVLLHSGTAQTNIPVTFRTNAISMYFMLQSQSRDVFSLFPGVVRSCFGCVLVLCQFQNMLKADSHIACRAHAAPMPFRCRSPAMPCR
jgi:hypothetical protein